MKLSPAHLGLALFLPCLAGAQGYPIQPVPFTAVKVTDAFELALRIPGWARNQPVPGDLYAFAAPDAAPVTLMVNGQSVALELRDGYAIVKRTWAKGDRVRLTLPMPVRAVVAHAQVAADRDRVAFQRGPIVFCAEAVDNAGASVRTRPLPAATVWQAEYRADLLGGIEVLRATASGGPTVQAIPYFAWANRGPDEMAVWFPTTTGTAANLKN